MATAELTGYADAQAVIDALDLAGTAVQPDDLAVPTGVGETDGLMTHEDKAKLDALTATHTNLLQAINFGALI
jgi:hypothetical protein